MYQILVNGKPMRPTNGKPYVFTTEKKALETVDMCYGLHNIGKFVEIIKI